MPRGAKAEGAVPRGGRRLRLLGSSMWPLLRQGVELEIDPEPRAIRLGDVVVYRRGGRTIAHRVLGIRESERGKVLVLKGDGALAFDPPLALERIRGRVVAEVAGSTVTDYTSRRRRLLHAGIAVLSRTVGRIHVFYRGVRPGSRAVAPEISDRTGVPGESMKKNGRPRQRGGIFARELGDETILYDSLEDSTHVLTASAARVWKLCDARHSARQIEDEVRVAYEVPEGVDVAADVGEILDRFADLGLLAPTTAPEPDEEIPHD